VFSQFFIYLSLPSVRPCLWYCIMWRHVLCWTDRWHKNFVSVFCRSPRFKKQKVSETPVTNTKKFTAVLLGAFAQSRKSLVSFAVSVRPSATISTTPTVRISVKVTIGDFYEKSVEKLEIWLKSVRTIGHWTWRLS
jgi:hypothetical protein